MNCYYFHFLLLMMLLLHGSTCAETDVFTCAVQGNMDNDFGISHTGEVSNETIAFFVHEAVTILDDCGFLALHLGDIALNNRNRQKRNRTRPILLNLVESFTQNLCCLNSLWTETE